MNHDAARFRPVRMGRMAARAERRADGIFTVASTETLGPYPRSIVDAIEDWSRRTPDSVMIAEREGSGWRNLTYGEVMDRIPPLAQALLDAGLSAERPLLILSGNEIEHLLLGLAAMWVGIPYSPVSPAYSLISTDFDKLRAIVARLTPGLVYASDGDSFGAAIRAAVPPGTPIVVRNNPPHGHSSRAFSDLAAVTPTGAVATAHDAITPETVAKILFTSGSTDQPKGVITTNRMLSCNQAMIRKALAFLADEPPVLIDWMPWHHVAGGSHNTGIAFTNGGSFYIDDGLPTPGRIKSTVETSWTYVLRSTRMCPRAMSFWSRNSSRS